MIFDCRLTIWALRIRKIVSGNKNNVAPMELLVLDWFILGLP